MILNILHLSDLHISENNILQGKVLKSMANQIALLKSQNITYDIIIISGDIAHGGKECEYQIAHEFLNDISLASGCSKEAIYTVPGNHDVNRSEIKSEHLKWWYNFENEKDLTDNLNSDLSFPVLIKKNEAFLKFSESYAKVTRGKYGEFVHELIMPTNNLGIRLVGLNSSIFCGFDGDDKERLALGIDQVDKCFDESSSKNEIVISIVHHPKKCFHNCEKATISMMERNSDIILSGHLHVEDIVLQRGATNGSTILVSAGAGYESKAHGNAFNSIRIDLSSGDGDITFYKYLPDQHKWLQNKDIEAENNGVFPFSFSTKLNSEGFTGNDDPNRTSNHYKLVINASYNDLNRDKVNNLLTQLQTVTNDLSTSFTRIEKGSVKLYFETKNIIDGETLEKIEKIIGLEVIEFSKVEVEDIHTKTGWIDKSVYHWITFLKNDFHKDLTDPETNFSHNRVETITLKDLFVVPNLKRLKLEKTSKEREQIITANDVFIKKADSDFKVVIYGDDSSGKTTLARWCYEKLYDEGYIPILINGSLLKDISENRTLKIFQQAFEKQYNGIDKGNLTDYQKDRIIIIIDDFHRVRLKESKYKASLIRTLEKLFNNIIFTGNDLMQFESYVSKSGSEKYLLAEFDRFSIVEFGPKLRHELVRKWNYLGQNQLEPNELIRLNNESESHIDSIIGKNFVPSYPIYILTILQAREAVTTQKPEYSIHGFYYELLINDALNKAVKKKEDISLYYNYITEYAYFLFNEDIRLDGMEFDSFIIFHDYYCKEYNITIGYKDVLDTLINSKLLKIKNDVILITYKYVYYFFVAKYLANNISNIEIRDKVKALCQRVHRDEFSSIVMYLTHLSKDQFIISELLENSKELFSDLSPTKLELDVTFINDMVNKLPSQIYEPIDVEKVREEELEGIEEMHQLEREFDSNRDILDYSLSEDIGTLDMISQMVKAIKTIEIVGQVTKKYWGELKASQKYDLAEETYMLGLRTLHFYFQVISEDTEMVVYFINKMFKKRYEKQDLNKAEIDKATRNYLFSICTMASFGIIKKITNAIGYDKLAGTFEDIKIKHDSNAVVLIDTSIKLDYQSRFPWDEIVRLKTRFENNFISKVVLQNLVIDYLYIYHTTIEEKQRICEYLDISMDAQRQIESQSVIKKD